MVTYYLFMVNRSVLPHSPRLHLYPLFSVLIAFSLLHFIFKNERFFPIQLISSKPCLSLKYCYQCNTILNRFEFVFFSLIDRFLFITFFPSLLFGLFSLFSYPFSAVKGSKYVIHVASPFPSTIPSDPEELIKPAVDGTLNILKACAEVGGIKRVVLTSSIVAVYGNCVFLSFFKQ